MAYPKRAVGLAGEPIDVHITGTIARRLRQLHEVSQAGEAFGGRTHIEKYVIEIIEAFLVDRRSGLLPDSPDRHWERNGCDADHAIA